MLASVKRLVLAILAILAMLAFPKPEKLRVAAGGCAPAAKRRRF